MKPNTYWLAWHTRFNNPVLVDYARSWFIHATKVKLMELDCKVIDFEVEGDSVRLMIQARPNLTPNAIVGQVKRFSEAILKREIPSLRSPLWSKGFCFAKW
jgi:REP element-mobilizing transposase RayT